MLRAERATFQEVDYSCSLLMSPTLALAFLAIPLLLYIGIVLCLHEDPSRSLDAARFSYKMYPVGPSLFLGLCGISLYIASEQSTADVLYIGLILYALIGAGLVEWRTVSTFTYIVRFYLDPTAWSSITDRGQRWQYEMKYHFVENPEYADSLVLSMLGKSSSYDSLVAALTSKPLPEETKYEQILDRHVWGLVLPTARSIAANVVPNEVFANSGNKYSHDKAPEEVFQELQLHSPHNQTLLMDRWQYYWCLRNLNFIDKCLKHALARRTKIAVVCLGAGIFLIGLVITTRAHLSVDTFLRAEAAGALLWLLVMSGGASILIVRAFKGTGTFSISFPCRGSNFDPLWSRVIQVGILSFAASFLVYGMGSPFLLDPTVLSHFQIGTRFVIYAGISFLFCIAVFINHTTGLHDLMLGSRDNALDRTSVDLRNATTEDARQVCIERFKELRELRVWPIRGSTVAEIAIGIVLPIAVQLILLYSGLQAK